MSEFSFTPNSINLELNDTTSDSPSLQSTRSAMNNSALQLALTESERKTVAEFAKKIDITNPSIVLKYGSSAQKKIASFSDTTLEKVRTKILALLVKCSLILLMNLTDSIPKVQQIQSTGREKRKNAEYELALMEKELKQKLLELN